MDNKFEISVFSPCKESIEFRKQFPDFKAAWKNCLRGDWMLWIAQKLDVDNLKLTTAKALCANTVRHLMNDERSLKAVDVAILFGQGKTTIEELKDAADNAYAAVDATNTNHAASAASIYSVMAAYTAAALDYTYNVTAVHTAAYTAASVDSIYSVTVDGIYTDCDAKTKNQLQTADICREILTEVVFEAIDKLTA